jgi:hypothetical protein
MTMNYIGLQKFRADIAGDKQPNGAIPYYTKWMGGLSLALVRHCPISNTVIGISPRTVYVRGEADTFFSQPAVCGYTHPATLTSPKKRVILRGYLTINDNGIDDNGSYEFRCYKNQGV